MARRYGLGFWVAVLAAAATFVAEPSASLEFTRDVFTVVGEFGGSLVTELVDGDSSSGGV